jgi:very-short-patch-repair endonuclease
MHDKETRIERFGRKIHYARHLRRHMTTAERILWESLRNRQLHNCKFRRQTPIDEFIVDFLCIEKKLVIEVDGSVHEHQKTYDKEREDMLRSRGYTIIRFSNDDILTNFSATLSKINDVLSPLSGQANWRSERGRG